MRDRMEAVVGLSLLVLALVFTGLKLMGYIEWPWWGILAPIWIPIALVATMMAFVTAIVKIFSRFE